jgi:hypothetical protein
MDRAGGNLTVADLIVVDDIGMLPDGQEPPRLTEAYGTSWNLHRPQPLHRTGPTEQGETAWPVTTAELGSPAH